MKIAVDFDGTIVEHRYPKIGKEMLFAFDTLKALQKQGHQLILWTFRAGKELEEAVDYCRKNGIEFYAVNSSYPEEKFDKEAISRKIQADIFIDDRNVGGFPGWGRIYQMINPQENPSIGEEMNVVRSGRSWFSRIFRLFAFPVLVFAFAACGNRNGITANQLPEKRSLPKVTTLLNPAEGLKLHTGDSVVVELAVPDTVLVDSVEVFINGKKEKTIAGTLLTEIPTVSMSTGKAGIRTRVYLSNGQMETHSRQVILLSDIVPVEYGYRVVNVYPHDVRAYTQGLEYEDGVLYEGTGQKNESSLRKVRLETGEILKIRNLDGDIFGEGITIFGNRIYQLTYKSQMGFVYDKNTFEEIQKIYYQNREGWGLSHNKEELIMSDGTNIIYFIDPELFTVNRQIEVYTDKRADDSLNELEYINGRIWANRYYTDEIVIIDPATGKVEGRINLKGILPVSDRKPTTDVLNGIAWDREGDRIFVTGKYWPKLFEIRIFEK